MGRRRLAQVGTVAFTLVAFVACATPRAGRFTAVPPRPTVTPPSPPVAPPEATAPAPGLLGREESGEASWYGRAHHGRPTASGEPYDMRALTAAHRTLPLGTRILVTHVASGRTVEVRINDRGPFVRGRILDLSRAAAERLGVVGAGVAAVRIRVVALPDGAREAGTRAPAEGR